MSNTPPLFSLQEDNRHKGHLLMLLYKLELLSHGQYVYRLTAGWWHE